MRRRSVRVLFFLFVLLLVIQYSLNVFGYYSRPLPELLLDRVKQLGLADYSEDDAIRVIYTGSAVGASIGSLPVADFTVVLSQNSSSSAIKRRKGPNGEPLPACPAFPPNLVGTMRVSKDPVELEYVSAQYAQLFQPGGFYVPPQCDANHKG